jgi:histidine ammonia-lyase
MGAIAARHARMILDHVERILAIELVVSAQALDFRLAAMADALPGSGVADAHARVRAQIRHLDGDREPGPDLATATALIREGGLSGLAGPAT